ncbi:MAG: hypothetical protein DRR16_10665 [Candidatus Parabeggiatoa sp. nov. 3]|nr:MAG: hypothetical protein DRR00_08375 [Gammaproteobacteria bacterium]RKZ66724.1 MAG: hypothetical protein DRQ99_08790 [Gammaproteobacteria bacterium]RKZ86040.1 MAG: hypothetical protein DRR16_10665 [Gammaproteobacteria bacterium]
MKRCGQNLQLGGGFFDGYFLKRIAIIKIKRLVGWVNRPFSQRFHYVLKRNMIVAKSVEAKISN